MTTMSKIGGSNLTDITRRAPQTRYQPEDFDFQKVLGTGSYSKVWKTTFMETEQEYALKIMSKRHITREKKEEYVKMERIILDGLDHPGVVRLMFTFQTAEDLYMGMECCDGGELFNQIRQKGKLTLDEARFYAAELVDILQYIHQYIVHRDIKPENLLITSDGHLKLIDFGSAKMIRPLPSTAFILPKAELKSGGFVGTAQYVSPEVLNSQPVTMGADLWALGCLIYQMLEGGPPFKERSEYLIFEKILARDFQMPSHFPPAAKDLIDRLLIFEPERRLGAGALGYAELKSHPFFHGVDWSNVRGAVPPVLVQVLRIRDGELTDEDELVGDALDIAEWEAAHMVTPLKFASTDSSTSSMSQSSDSSYAGVGRSHETITALGDRLNALSAFTMGGVVASSLELKHGAAVADDCQQPHWQKVLNAGEALMGTSLVSEDLQRRSAKGKQLIFIRGARFPHVSAVKMTCQGDIGWTAYLVVAVGNPFTVSTCSVYQKSHVQQFCVSPHASKSWTETSISVPPIQYLIRIFVQRAMCS